MTERECMRTELGAYLVGSLEPAERDAVDHHLPDCADCLAELAELAPLPELLSLLDADDARRLLLMPSAAEHPRALDVVPHDQDRRRLRRWMLAGCAAAVVAVAAAALPQVLPVGNGAETTLAAVSAASVSGAGSIEDRAGGTAVRLELTGLTPAMRYRAYATAHDGRTELAAGWMAAPGGSATVNGATAIPRAQLASIEVRTVDGRQVLTLPC